LAAISGVAEFPDRIRNRFVTQEHNAAGIYLTTWFVNGVLTPVIVDNWFPERDGGVAFTQGKETTSK
jgi:hypothetical protein